MHLKKIAAAAVLGLGLASGVQAASYDFGNVGIQDAPYTDAAIVGKGFFVDTWDFKVTETLLSKGSLFDLPLTIGGRSTDIINLDFSLWVGRSDDNIADVEVVSPFLNKAVGNNGDEVSGSGVFTPGDYYFVVTGKGVGTGGGSYAFSVLTAPVPEPETYAMMLSGLGLALTAARRRAKKNG